MTLSGHQQAFALDVARLIQFADEQGYAVTFGEAYRTEDQQRIYVRKGLSRTMDSYHRKRLAVDLNLFKDGVYLDKAEAHRPLGEYWKSLNERNRWGGDFQGLADGNHYERRLA